MTIQQNLTSLVRWSSQQQMSFDTEKCTVMRITNKTQSICTNYMDISLKWWNITRTSSKHKGHWDSWDETQKGVQQQSKPFQTMSRPLLLRGTKNRLVIAYNIQNSVVEFQPSRFYTHGDTHTTGGQRLRQQHTNKDLYIYSFVPRSTREWNVLSDSMASAVTVDDFKAGINGLANGLDRSCSRLSHVYDHCIQS